MSLSAGAPMRFLPSLGLLVLLLAASARAEGLEPLPREPGIVELRPGLVVERVEAPALPRQRERPLVTLVHVDPSRFRFELKTAARDGGSRTPPRWLEDFALLGVINASMHLPNERSTGLMVDDGHVNNGAVNPSFGGFLAFGAREVGLPPLLLQGRDCDGFDLGGLRTDYRTVVQNYRLLDCERHGMPWRDEKLYSAAAIAVDRDGWLVLVHTGRPYRMTEFGRWLADEERHLTGAVFVEGGPQAALLVQSEGRELREIGRYQGALATPVGFRSVPNVIGFRPRPTTP